MKDFIRENNNEWVHIGWIHVGSIHRTVEEGYYFFLQLSILF